MRLNKFLSSAGIASRRKCDEIIIQGKVKVNDSVVKELGTQIDQEKDKIECEGKILKLPSSFVYIKLNKPKGYLCTANDDKGRKTIFDIVKIPNIRLFNIGRLDYETEGLLILTNDGDLAQALMHPSHQVEKEYYATIKGTLKESELAVLRSGVVLNGSRLPKSKVELVDITKDASGEVRTRLSIKIIEGQNRQIRHMFEGIGRDILLLKRVRIGEIKLGGLSRGEFKPLTAKEIDLICKNIK